MALPKRRHSSARGRKRRTHDALAKKVVSTCSHCNATVMPHCVCPNCGYYRGRQIVTKETA